MCSNFQGYFEINDHKQHTRNNSKLVKLPKVKLEYARQSFSFAAAKIYNDLPIDIRSEKFLRILRVYWTYILFDFSLGYNLYFT